MGFDITRVKRETLVTVYRNVTCDKCGKTPPVMQDMTDEDGLQYDNVLIVQFNGGYGMFVDDINRLHSGYDPSYDKVLCHECAHLLADWFGLDASGWHTHVSAENGGTQHPDHHATNSIDQ